MLKKLREDKNLTQKQVAELLNVGESTISLYESGMRRPPITKLVKYAEILGVTVDKVIDCFKSAQ